MMHVFVCSSKLSRHSASKAGHSGHSHRAVVICVTNKTAEKSALYPANVDICMNLDVHINQLSGGKRRLEIVVACRL